MSDPNQNRYERLEKLGSGLMGEVWLVKDTLLNREVAIKYLTITESTTYKDLFLSEARMLASLHHPKITLIYDAVFDEQKNQFYLVMEYVKGRSLARMLDDTPGMVPLEDILDIIIGVLEALEYAHKRGIVHRDIKPENVIVQEDGLKLTDFGLAGLMSLLSEGKNFTVGTPAYISPEQIQGIPTDGRADLYSLGIMLFEMCCGGYQPFEHHENISDLLEAHLHEAPPSLKEYSPDTPIVIEHVVNRLLAKEADNRYPSAKAVLDVMSSIKFRQKFNQPHLQLLSSDGKPLLGRSGELVQIETLWAACQSTGTPRLVLVLGEAGIGKSRFARQFLEANVIDKGLVALAGRCDESGIPYAPFAQILATIFDKGLAQMATAKYPLEQFLEQVPGLAHLLQIPEHPKPKTAEKGLNSQTQWQFSVAVLNILAELGPSALFLEDAIFLDEASVALLQFLIRHTKTPLFIIAACRGTVKTIPWFDSFFAAEKSIITIPPLPESTLETYLVNLLGGPVSESLVTLIKQRAQRNPHQIEELVDQLLDEKTLYQQDDGQWHYITTSKKSKRANEPFFSEAILNAFTRRLNKLDEESRNRLALAALTEPSHEFNFDIWVTLLGGKEQTETAQAILDEALKKRVLRRIGPNRYAFHPIEVGNTLIDTLTAARQRELHVQIAKILADRRADPILIGYHYQQAGLGSKAAQYLEQAGAKAMAVNANDAAIAYYNRAVSLVESQTTYKILGILYRQKAKWPKSVEAFQKALHLAKQNKDTSEQAQILNGLSLTLWLYDHYKEAYEHALAVLRLPDVSEVEQATAQSHLGMILWLMGHLQEAKNWCQKSVDILLKQDDKLSLAAAYNRLGIVYFSSGELNNARIASQQSLTLSQKLSDDAGQAYSLSNLGIIATEQGQFKQAWAHLDIARRLFEKIHSNHGLMIVYTYQGHTMLYQNHPDKALTLLTKALHLAMKIDKRNAYGVANIYLLIARASIVQGQLERAKAATQDALKLVEAADNKEYMAIGWAILAQIYAKQDDALATGPMYKKALHLFQRLGIKIGLVRTKLNYAQYLIQRGQEKQGIPLEKEARAEAEKMGLYLF